MPTNETQARMIAMTKRELAVTASLYHGQRVTEIVGVSSPVELAVIRPAWSWKIS
jgi:hypothetical protein